MNERALSRLHRGTPAAAMRHLGRIVIVVAAMAIGWPSVAVAQQNQGPGTIRLTITAPAEGVPLVCGVPVTPGQPVVIKVAVADASDAFFDSAILLGSGIWSE